MSFGSCDQRFPQNSNMTEGEFVGKVDQIKEHIQAGDVFQLVLSQRFRAPYSG